ncbi:MAG: hypothetical protein U0871_07615 [Gemmataceae bacterium]
MTGFVSLLVVTLAAPVPPQAEPWTVARRPTNDPAIKLLQDDRLDEAMASRAFDKNPRWAFCGGLPTSAETALRMAERVAGIAPGDALCVYETYLRHFPARRHIEWDEWGERRHWPQVAAAYLDLLGKVERPTADWFQQSVAARPVFDDLLAAFGRRDHVTYRRLADRVITDYPQSLYVQPAVLTVAVGLSSQGHTGEFLPGPAVVAEYFQAMHRAKVPESNRHLVWQRYAGMIDHADATAGVPSTSAPAWGEAVRRAKSQMVRRDYWKWEVERRLKTNNLPTAREAVAAYLDTYAEPVRATGRQEIVSHIAHAGHPDEARWWVEEWRRAGATFSAGQALASIGDSHVRNGQWPDAVNRYEEALAAEPSGFWVAHTELSLARAYGQVGKDSEMIRLLTRLAGPTGRLKLLDGFVRSGAQESLADHYLAKRDWMQALRWYEAWQPISGCGTCDASMEAKKKKAIETCRRAIADGR